MGVDLAGRHTTARRARTAAHDTGDPTTVAPPQGQMHPGRQLAVLAGIFVVLYALVFFSGASGSFTDRLHPKLGLDLIGGTRVTMIAQTAGGQAPQAEQLERARQIIENRVNGRGVSEAEVVTEGNENIVVSVPGQNADLSSIGAAAELRFRKVINRVTDASAAAAANPSPGPSGSATPGPSGSATPGPSGSATPQAGASPAATGTPAPQASGAGGGAAVAPAQSAAPTASPSAGPAPSTSPGAGSEDPSTKTPEQLRADAERKVGPAAWQAASALTAPAELGADPTATQTYEAFGTLLPEEVAALPPAMQFNVPTIGCQQLNQRPPGSVVDPGQQAVACDDTTKYFMDVAKVLGTDVSEANSVINPQNNERTVSVEWKSSGQSKWTALTKEAYDNAGEPKCQPTAVDENGRCLIGIVLDNRVVSAPAVNQVQPGGTEITGQFTKAAADELASNLRYGALPVTFRQGESQNVSATLGTEQLRAGLIAAGIGMLLVMVYAFFYYRLLGTVIFLSLILSGLLVFGALVVLGRQIGFTLTLAGIAGFIVSLGVAADSFVIYFERLKDEIREGRSPRSAVPRAWARARRTIISANTISLLSAVILYLVSVGSVKGFAFALGLATVLDLVVVFLFRHPIMTMFANTRAFLSPRVSGLGRVLQRDDGAAAPPSRSGRVKEA
jgi:preprotein translocase subunit SecD